MLIAISLFLIGFALSLKARIVVLVPVCVVLVLGFTTVWLITGEMDKLRVAILIGYIFALNTGYLVGAAVVKEANSG